MYPKIVKGSTVLHIIHGKLMKMMKSRMSEKCYLLHPKKKQNYVTEDVATVLNYSTTKNANKVKVDHVDHFVFFFEPWSKV